jgi:hypothetical protein
MAETFNDPFVNNAVPWWLSPNGNCQNNLETGDVIEGLPNAQFPIVLNGFTWHPQNKGNPAVVRGHHAFLRHQSRVQLFRHQRADLRVSLAAGGLHSPTVSGTS